MDEFRLARGIDASSLGCSISGVLVARKYVRQIQQIRRRHAIISTASKRQPANDVTVWNPNFSVVNPKRKIEIRNPLEITARVFSAVVSITLFIRFPNFFLLSDYLDCLYEFLLCCLGIAFEISCFERSLKAWNVFFNGIENIHSSILISKTGCPPAVIFAPSITSLTARSAAPFVISALSASLGCSRSR